MDIELTTLLFRSLLIQNKRGCVQSQSSLNTVWSTRYYYYLCWHCSENIPSQASLSLLTTCRNYLLIVKAWKQRTKIRMGRLPFSHVRMNYFWWAKTERIVVYSAVNLLFRNNKIQLSKCHYITIFMNCKISLTYISETHWKQSIKFQIESMFHFPFS